MLREDARNFWYGINNLYRQWEQKQEIRRGIVYYWNGKSWSSPWDERIEVIAWIPLPKPYEGEEKNQ